MNSYTLFIFTFFDSLEETLGKHSNNQNWNLPPKRFSKTFKNSWSNTFHFWIQKTLGELFLRSFSQKI